MDNAIKAGVIAVEKIDTKVYLKYNNKSYCWPKTIYTQRALNALKLPNLYKNTDFEKGIKWGETNSKKRKEMNYYKRINAYSYKHYFAVSKEEAQRMVKKEKIRRNIWQIPVNSTVFLKRAVKYIYGKTIKQKRNM